MAPPGGLPWNCQVESPADPPLQIGAAASWLNTTLDLDDAGRTGLDLDAVSLSVGFPLNDSWTARIAGGAVTGGKLRPGSAAQHSIENGFLGAISLEKQVPRTGGFVDQWDYSVSLSGLKATTKAATGTDEADYTAFDLRLGARAVKRVSSGSVGYLAGRVFGGPVNWEYQGQDVSGSDIHHYQLALGYAAQVGKAGVFAEWSALGEQGFTTGFSTLW